MSLWTALQNDPGALIIGALWGLTTIGNQIRESRRNQRTQSLVDAGSATLNTNLQKAYESQTVTLREERDRADRLANAMTEVSVELGQLRASLRYVTEDRDETRQEVLRLKETIEQLVVENRNKDKSITQLVSVNRQILRSIGSDVNALESEQPENTHGTQDRLEELPHTRQGVR